MVYAIVNVNVSVSSALVAMTAMWPWRIVQRFALERQARAVSRAMDACAQYRQMDLAR
jgi:hypothetical protein